MAGFAIMQRMFELMAAPIPASKKIEELQLVLTNANSSVEEKNKDDKISKEFYYLGNMQASGKVKEFIMPNTDKTAVEIEWLLDVPVREDLYEYIVNE